MVGFGDLGGDGDTLCVLIDLGGPPRRRDGRRTSRPDHDRDAVDERVTEIFPQAEPGTRAAAQRRPNDLGRLGERRRRVLGDTGALQQPQHRRGLPPKGCPRRQAAGDVDSRDVQLGDRSA